MSEKEPCCANCKHQYAKMTNKKSKIWREFCDLDNKEIEKGLSPCWFWKRKGEDGK